MDLLILVGPFSPFEKHDLACLLYKKILNKGAFQLIVNTFDDIHDRQNLIHRLKLDNRFNKVNSGEELVSDCSAINKVTRH